MSLKGRGQHKAPIFGHFGAWQTGIPLYGHLRGVARLRFPIFGSVGVARLRVSIFGSVGVARLRFPIFGSVGVAILQIWLSGRGHAIPYTVTSGRGSPAERALSGQSDRSAAPPPPCGSQSARASPLGHAPGEDGGAAGAAVAAPPGTRPEAAPEHGRVPRGAAAVPGSLGRLRRAPRVHPAQRAGRDPRVPRDGPAGTGAARLRGPPAAQGAGAEALQDHDPAQHHGPDPVRVPAPGPHLVLHDQLRRGGDARGQRRRPRGLRPRLRAVPGGRCAAVPGLPPGAVHGPVLRQRARPRQGPADAGALRLPPAPLRHHLVAAGHADPASRGRRLRHQARGREPGRGLLFWGGGGERGRRPRRVQLRRHPRVPHRLLLPQQRLRHLHAHGRAVPGRRDSGAGPWLRAALHPRGRERRFRRVQRHQGGSAPRRGREPALPHRGHDLPHRPPQHERRQLRVPLGGRGELLGQAGSPDLAAAALPGQEGLVGRAAGAGLEEELPKNGAGGVRAGGAGAEAAASPALLRRLPGDAPAAAAAAGGAAAAPGDLRGALPAPALPKVTPKIPNITPKSREIQKIPKIPPGIPKPAPNPPPKLTWRPTGSTTRSSTSKSDPKSPKITQNYPKSREIPKIPPGILKPAPKTHLETYGEHYPLQHFQK